MTNQNDKYQTHPLGSPFAMHQNFSKFITDLDETSLCNILRNDKFRWVDGSDFRHWTLSGGTFSRVSDINTNSVTATIGIGAKMTQVINDVLDANTKYTLVCVCKNTNNIKFSVDADNSNQIFNLIEQSEIDSASISGGTTTDKTVYMLEFKTNTTAISGGIYFNVENIYLGGSITAEIYSMYLHKGNIGFDNIQTNDAYGASYADLSTNALSANYATLSATASKAIDSNTLEGYPASTFLNAVTPITYDGTIYYDTSVSNVGNSIKIVIGGTEYYIPSSLEADGPCHYNCHNACHGWHMCYTGNESQYKKIKMKIDFDVKDDIYE